jgi:transcriptional regulator with XRE-family HTH domain
MPDLDHLSAQVVSRRVALGYRNRQALADAAGISIRTLGDIETGRRSNFDPSTIAALEHALEWDTGSVAEIVDGYDPTLRSAPADIPVDAAIEMVMQSDLPDGLKRRFANLLVDDRIAADRRRIDLARALIEAAS